MQQLPPLHADQTRIEHNGRTYSIVDLRLPKQAAVLSAESQHFIRMMQGDHPFELAELTKEGVQVYGRYATEAEALQDILEGTADQKTSFWSGPEPV